MNPLRFAIYLTVLGVVIAALGVVAYYQTDEIAVFWVGFITIVAGLVLLAVYGIVRFVKASARD